MPCGSDSLLEHRGVQKHLQGGIITMNSTSAITLPQGFSFQGVTEAPSQPCWQWLSRGTEESINLAASQAKLCLQPQMGASPAPASWGLRSPPSETAASRTSPTCCTSCISLRCPAHSRGDISDCTVLLQRLQPIIQQSLI